MIQIGQNIELDKLAERHWIWLKKKINYDEIKKKSYNDCMKILDDLDKTEVEKKNCALKVILKDHLYDHLEDVIKAPLDQLKNIKQNNPSLFLNENYFIKKKELEKQQEKFKEASQKWHNQCDIANGKKKTSPEVKEKKRLHQEYKDQKDEYDKLKSEEDRIYNEFICNTTVRYLKKDEKNPQKEKRIPVNLNDLLHYNSFRDDPEWNAYVLCNSLDVSVCPYCNRQYIFIAEKHEGGWISSAQLDHFLPKSSNPLFSCSFYNLIPSCYCCNHGKLDSFEETIYPYVESFENDGKFCIDFSEGKTIKNLNLQEDIVIKIDVAECQKKILIENSKKIFHLEELYNKHQLEIHDFVKRINCCMECREHDFQNITIREDLLNENQKSELILGMPLDASETEYPLKKMKTDILEQIEKSAAIKLR